MSNKGNLDEVIKLLGITSKLVSIFNDMKPVTSLGDPRLVELRSAVHYFKAFHDLKAEDTFTTECLWDLNCCIEGILELCDIAIPQNRSVVIGLLNSDVLENHFCNVRTLYNGANRNPTYKGYCNIQNSILLTQPIILSKKRNA